MKKDFDPVKKQLDALLADIKAKKNAIGFMEKALAAQIERVAAQWDPEINKAEQELKLLEQELIGMAKYNKADLFGDRDRVDLKHGALIRQIERRVKRVKGMLERLKASGLREAIKTVESVDWDTVEKWDDERLAAVGTRRTAKEIIAYEVSG